MDFNRRKPSIRPALSTLGHRTTRRLLPTALLCSTILGLLSFTPLPARSGEPSDKSDRFVQRRLGRNPMSGWSSVIVRVGGDLTPAHKSRIRSLGGYVYRHLPVIGAAAVRVPSRNLSRLAALPFVQRLSADAVVEKSDEFTVGSSGADVAFSQHHLTGRGIAVAVIDSGVRFSHEDLRDDVTGKPRTLASVNFSPDANTADDLCGHGTHVAGIIAGNGSASTGDKYYRTFYGIARRANLVNLRVLDANGQGAVSNVVRAIQWAIDNRSAYNIRVINLSLGHPVGESYTTDPLCLAVEKAYQAGIVVVTAAGNRGRLADSTSLLRNNEGYGTAYASIQSPANSPYTVTVGAMKATGSGRDSDRIATYSGRGPTRLDFVLKPDIVAPGNRVISTNANNSYLDRTYPDNVLKASEYSSNGNDNSAAKYLRLSGTSMAAPVVAGAVALLLEADSALSPDTVKARLMVSADKIWGIGNGSTDPLTYGAGYLNIPAALRCPLVATRPAVSPTLSRGLLGGVYIQTQGVLWGDSGVWGTGIGSFAGVYGSQVLWGEDELSDSQVLWGESVWADQVLWGEDSSSADLSAAAIYGEK